MSYFIKATVLAALFFSLVLPLSAQAGAPIRVADPREYRVEPLRSNAFVYIDREYVFDRIPNCFSGGFYVLTANAHKFTSGDQFLSLFADEPMVIYIGFDQRYSKRPAWLERIFQPVPSLGQLTVSNPEYIRQQSGKADSPKVLAPAIVFSLYRRQYEPGRIDLGGNLPEGVRSNFAMYTVIAMPASQHRCS